MMMTYFEALVAMRAFAGPRGYAQTTRIFATHAWVRASCERDCLPAWLVELVMQRVEADLLANDFPLVEHPVELTDGERSELLGDGSEQMAIGSEQSTAEPPPPDPEFENIITQGALGRKPPPGRPNPLRTSGSNKESLTFHEAMEPWREADRRLTGDVSLAVTQIVAVAGILLSLILNHIIWK